MSLAIIDLPHPHTGTRAGVSTDSEATLAGAALEYAPMTEFRPRDSQPPLPTGWRRPFVRFYRRSDGTDPRDRQRLDRESTVPVLAVRTAEDVDGGRQVSDPASRYRSHPQPPVTRTTYLPRPRPSASSCCAAGASASESTTVIGAVS